MKNDKIRKTALLGILGALALVLSFAESLLMPQTAFLPLGVKPGLSNIVTMLVTDSMGFFGGLYIVLLKAVFALVTRGATAGLMSLSGGMLSLSVVALMLKIKSENVTMIGIGVLSSCAHNMGQVTASCLITGTGAIMNYAPFLLLFGIMTGVVTGTILQIVIPKIQKATVKI